MKDIRLGFINFSNTVPIYYGILTGKVKFPGILVKDIPANLNRMLKDGTLDISPISSIEYARYEEKYYALKNFCINSDGYVRSVILVSKYPLEELDGKKVGLTPASETSRALLKVLFADYLSIKPVYSELPSPSLKDNDEVDGALLIGDQALDFRNPEYPYCFDLGNLWKEKTSLPVVFALWAVRREVADKHKDKVRALEELLEESYQLGLKEPQGIIDFSLSLCPNPVCSYEEYFKHLGYRFSEDKREALLMFYRKASEMSLCKPCENLAFYD